jgi:hypothetical protein
MDRDLIESFVPPVYSRTPRNSESYRATYLYCSSRLAEILAIYRGSTNDQQTLRLVRDDMDNLLRRYHGYAIKERIGAHYREVGIDQAADFEHLIPAARIRDMMIAGVISIDQALNCPTVQLSRAKHHALKEAGWSSHTPDVWRPFRRYTQVFEAEFETHDGRSIDPEAWTIADHYQYFGYLTQVDQK